MNRLSTIFCLLLLTPVTLFPRVRVFPKLTGPYLGQEPPGDTPVLFAPGIISTGKEHSAAMFTPDGGVLWILAPGAYSAQGLHKKPIILKPPSGGVVLSN